MSADASGQGDERKPGRARKRVRKGPFPVARSGLAVTRRVGTAHTSGSTPDTRPDRRPGAVRRTGNRPGPSLGKPGTDGHRTTGCASGQVDGTSRWSRRGAGTGPNVPRHERSGGGAADATPERVERMRPSAGKSLEVESPPTPC